MFGDVLCIEQPIAAGPEARDEMNQRDFGSVACAMKHALAEESSAKRHPIEPADKALAVIDFDGMTMSAFEQRAIDAADAHIDPRAGPILLRLGTTVDDRIEVAIHMHSPWRRAYGASEPSRNMKSLERNDSAHIRLDPVQGRIVRAFGHGEDAAGVGLEQDLRSDLNESAFAVCHDCDPGNGGTGRRSQ